MVYLDDFLVVRQTKQECQLAFDTLLQLLQALGFQISWHKVIGPTQKLVFLSIELDTLQCKMALPQEKLEDLHQVVTAFLSRCRGLQES